MNDRKFSAYLIKHRIYNLIPFVILYPVILFARTNDIDSITKILIPVFVVYILINAIIINIKKRGIRYYILIFAFVAVCAGDFLINLTSAGRYCVIPFSLTHISLTIYYFSECRFRKTDAALLLPVLIISGILLYNNLDLMNGILLKIVFPVYLVILSLMLWRACCYIYNDCNIFKKIFIIAGSVLFYVTDVLVGISAIDVHADFAFWIWLIYPVSLISLSVFNWFDEPVKAR